MNETQAIRQSDLGTVAMRQLLAGHRDFCARLGLLDAGEALDEGGFPASVLADQSVNFAGKNLEADLVEDSAARKILGQVRNFEERRG